MLFDILVKDMTMPLADYLIEQDGDVYIPTPIADLVDPSNGDAGDFDVGLVEHTFVFEFIETAFMTTTGSPVLISFGNTAKTSGWFIQKSTISQPRLVHYCESGNVAQFNYRPYANAYPNGRHVMAVTIREDGTFVIFHNGYKASWKAGITKPVSYDDGLALGRYGNATPSNTASSVTFKRVRVYDKGFSDAQGEYITRPTVSVLDAATYPNQPTAKGILYTGQSNKSGRGNIGEANTYTNQARMKKMGLNMTYENYADPYNANTGSLQAALDDTGAANASVGHQMDDILTDRPDIDYLVAIPAAVPTTSWAEHWGHDLSVALITNTDANLYHVGTMLNAALQRAVAANFIVDIVAVDNHMGERDSATAVATPNLTVTAKAEGFVDIFRRCLNKPNLPVQFHGLHAWHSDLAAAQTQALWEGKKAAYEAVARSNVGTVDISAVTGTAGDRIHIPNAGLLTVGQAGSSFLSARI